MKKTILLAILLMVSVTCQSQILINNSYSTDTTLIFGSTVNFYVTNNGTTPDLVKWSDEYGCSNPVYTGQNYQYSVTVNSIITACVFDTVNLNGIPDTVYLGFQTLNITAVDDIGINTQNIENKPVSECYYDLLGRSTGKGILKKKNVLIIKK